jgi:hypothetical protein
MFLQNPPENTMLTRKPISTEGASPPLTASIWKPILAGRNLKRGHLLYAAYLLCLFLFILIEGNPSLALLFLAAIIGPLTLHLPQYIEAPSPSVVKADAFSDTGSKRIALRTANGFEFVKQSDIVCIQGGGNGANFIKVYQEGRPQPIIVSQTLSFTLKILSENEPAFRQFHKSYIIDIRKISRLCKDEDGCMMAVMDNDVKVPIPADKVAALKSSLGLE